MDKITKNKKRVRFIVIFLFCLLSCNADFIDLGGHFKYDTKRQYISGNQIGLLFPHIIKRQPERRDIPPVVIDFVYDKDFVLVKQIPKSPLEQIYYDDNNVNYPLGLDTTYYWIIYKPDGRVLGPFSYKEFCKTCELYRTKLQL